MIRAATPADRPALARLQSSLPRQSPDLLSYAIGVGDVLVSTVEDETRAESSVQSIPVGYVLVVPGDGVHVAELVVDPDHRREGRATALLDAVVADAPPGSTVTLAVAPDNAAALALYRGCGFAVDERRPDYFDGDPALWLTKRVE